MELKQTVLTTQKTAATRLHESAKPAFWCLAPSLLLLTLFTFYPMLATFYNSFFVTNIAGANSQFVGLTNYLTLLHDPVFAKSLLATLTYVVAIALGTVALALGLARLATMRLRRIGWFQTAFASTMGMSAAAASILWLFMFNPSVGQLTRLLKMLGMTHPNPLANTTGAMVVVVLVSVWLHLGFAFLILLSAFQSVPQTYYEVADLAGYSPLQQTRKITVPMISPTLFFLLVVEVIGGFKAFAEIDLITGGGPDNATNLLAHKIYVDAFSLQKFGPASAEAIVLTLLIAVTTWIQFRYTERQVFYG